MLASKSATLKQDDHLVQLGDDVIQCGARLECGEFHPALAGNDLKVFLDGLVKWAPVRPDT